MDVIELNANDISNFLLKIDPYRYLSKIMVRPSDISVELFKQIINLLIKQITCIIDLYINGFIKNGKKNPCGEEWERKGKFHNKEWSSFLFSGFSRCTDRKYFDKDNQIYRSCSNDNFFSNRRFIFWHFFPSFLQYTNLQSKMAWRHSCELFHKVKFLGLYSYKESFSINNIKLHKITSNKLLYSRGFFGKYILKNKSIKIKESNIEY